MIDNINFFVKCIFIITNILFVGYIVYKFYKRKYILSIFNINVYIFAFSLLFSSYFQFSKEAWRFLGVTDPSKYYLYLNKSILINCIGFIIFIITMFISEFDLIKNKRKIKSFDLIYNSLNNINKKYICTISIIIMITWIILILIAGQIPLFGDRLVFNKDHLRILRPIYLLINYMISIVGSYFSYKFIINKNKSDALFAVLSVIILLLTGNRGPVMFLILNIFIVFVYYNFSVKKATNFIILSVITVLILGVSMSFIRNKSFNTDTLVNDIKVEILYGNTFSDIRDGAFVLKGYDNKFDGYLYGKNYFADIISIIPSSISNYRETWSYGSFSTKTLFNMEDHYGLRGGWFLEPYINFGYIGIIIIALVTGRIFGLCEKRFWDETINKKENKFAEKQIFMGFNIFLAQSLFTSSIFNQFYAYLGIVILYIFISLIDKKLRVNK